MSGREQFWDIVCDYRPYLRLLLVFTTTLLVLAVFSVAIGGQGTGAYVISVVTIVLLLGTIIPVSYCIWRCGRVTNEFETDK